MGALSVIDRHTMLAHTVPLKDSGPVAQSTGSYPWRIDGDYSTMVTITNVGPSRAAFLARITYPGGTYWLAGQELDLGATAVFDLRALRDQRVPDRDGQTLPPAVDQGQFRWSIIDKTGLARLNGRAEIVSGSGGVSSSYSCGVCCPEDYLAGRLFPTTINVPITFVEPYNVLERFQDCYQNPAGEFPAYATGWWIQYSSITSAQTTGTGTAEASGLSEGLSQIEGQWESYDYRPRPDDECEQVPIPARAPGEVQVPCAQPVNFRQTGGTPAPNGALLFEYRWDSSTGNMQHLARCQVGERVGYSPHPSPSRLSAILHPTPTR